MPGNVALSISMILNGFDHLLVPFSFVLQDALIKDFIELRPVCIPLAPRYLGHMPALLQVIDKAVDEFVFAQDDLTLHIKHDGLFTDSPFNKLVVFLFSLASLSAELFEDPVDGEAGYSGPQNPDNGLRW